MSISNDLLTSTLYSIRETEVDNLFKKVAFLDGVRKAGGVETIDGGHKIQRPLALAEHSTITELTTGYEPISLAVNDVLRPAVYDWTDFVAPVVITRKEEMENSGEHAIVKILETRMKSVMGMLNREVNKQILRGDSTVLSSLNTLNGNSAGIGSATGFLEHLAVASQANSVGGISKATFNVPGWTNQFVNGGGGGLTMANLYDLYLACNAVAPSGDVKLIIMSAATMAAYRGLLFTQERFIDSKMLDGGRMAIAFNGAMVEQDTAMGFASSVAGTVDAYFLNFDGIKMVFHKDGDFALSPFRDISGTVARQADLYVKGQLVADHLGGQGVLINS